MSKNSIVTREQVRAVSRVSAWCERYCLLVNIWRVIMDGDNGTPTKASARDSHSFLYILIDTAAARKWVKNKVCQNS